MPTRNNSRRHEDVIVRDLDPGGHCADEHRANELVVDPPVVLKVPAEDNRVQRLRDLAAGEISHVREKTMWKERPLYFHDFLTPDKGVVVRKEQVPRILLEWSHWMPDLPVFGVACQGKHGPRAVPLPNIVYLAHRLLQKIVQEFVKRREPGVDENAGLQGFAARHRVGCKML